MIKIPATKAVVAVMFISGIALAPLLDDSDAPDPLADDLLPAQPPQFQVQKRQDGLTLSGHTLSRQHESDLLQVANSFQNNDQLVTDFQPLGIVPDHWADSTAQLVSLVSETAFAEARLSADELTVRGVIVDYSVWRSRLGAVKKSLPADYEVTSSTFLVDSAVGMDTICERAFESFESGPISFEESSADFRKSAYPRLDRVIALANACRNSRVLITGHTDASGNEDWNKQLSFARARTVGDYIAKGGIDRARLQVVGAGSSAPIADNATRYGRSLNRRIEIALSGDY